MGKEGQPTRHRRFGIREAAVAVVLCIVCGVAGCSAHAVGQIKPPLTTDQVLANAQQLQGNEITMTGYADLRKGVRTSQFIQTGLPVTLHREERHEEGGCILPAPDTYRAYGDNSLPANCIYWIGDLNQLRLEALGAEIPVGQSIGDGQDPVVVKGDFERNPNYFPGSGRPEWVIFVRSVR